MPFGLKNSPATFMRFINSAFRNLLDGDKVVIYIDDILIATCTIQENLNILNEVYTVLCENLLTLRYDKCSFMQKKINFLGYEIDKDGVRASYENVRAILEFPMPTNFKVLHSFIGLSSYFDVLLTISLL